MGAVLRINEPFCHHRSPEKPISPTCTLSEGMQNSAEVEEGAGAPEESVRETAVVPVCVLGSIRKRTAKQRLTRYWRAKSRIWICVCLCMDVCACVFVCVSTQ